MPLLRALSRFACLAFFAIVPLAANAALISVPTAHSVLTLWVADDGRVYELGYGATGAAPAPPEETPPREKEFFPAYGNGFVLEPALQATHADGNTSTDLIYVKHETSAAGDDATLTTIDLKDRFYPFFVRVFLKAYRKEDVMEAWTEIRQEEAGAVTLQRFASASPLFQAKEYYLTQFHGDWAQEGQMSEDRLDTGIKILDSKLGARASQYRFPSFILALDGPAREESGEVLGGSLEWSGSYQLAFEVDWAGGLRALSGINPFASQYHLLPGRPFVTPAMLWTWSDAGQGQVSRNFHAWARRYGIRDGDKPRPVLLNNWEATYFNFNEGKLVSLLGGAKELGCELFLLDDGWFGNKYPRNDDDAGLGDWQANTNKLPRGLGYLAREANQRGLRFGIWMEPEMVNPKSELYEQHPDWVIGQPHREPELSRHQLDLDLSNPAVKEYCWQCIDSILSTPGISYVKWDANRYVTQPGSPWLKPEDQSHLFIDYTHALYDLMGRMAEKFPQTMAMLCSGGGGRADYGALKYFDSFWPSDNTDPARRVFIQWAYSHFFPACAICAHVTRSGHRPLKFALDVAMSEDLGFDLDLSKTTPAERKQIAAAVELYKNDLRDVVGQGDLYRLDSPYDGPRAGLDYVSPDRGKAVLFVYQLKDGKPDKIKLRGLDPRQRYTVREVNLPAGASSRLPDDGRVLDGATLMRDGLVSPCKHRFDSSIIELYTSLKND